MTFCAEYGLPLMRQPFFAAHVAKYCTTQIFQSLQTLVLKEDLITHYSQSNYHNDAIFIFLECYRKIHVSVRKL